MDKKKGLILCRQVGSARAFQAWLSEPTTMQNFDLEIWSYPTCFNEFKNLTVPVTLINSFKPPLAKYDFIFTGTSLQASEDNLFVQWAKENKIPSFAFIDQWVNYKERFTESFLPDFTFVIDENAKIDLLALLPELKNIHAAGTPALNYINDFWNLHQRNPIKNRIYFATEPSSLKGKDLEYKNTHGFYDLDCLRYLIEYIEERQTNFWDLQILVHPIDTIERIKNELDLNQKFKNLKISISTETKTQVFCSADVIVGMRSFILLESSLLGIPTISLQIDRKTKSSLTDNRKNLLVFTEKTEISLTQNSIVLDNKSIDISENQWTRTLLKLLK